MVLKDEARFTKDRNAAMSAEQLARTPWIPPMFKPLMRTILDTDGVEHTRLRGLIHKAFTPRLIEQMRERVQRLSNELLDAAERRGKMDLIGSGALALLENPDQMRLLRQKPELSKNAIEELLRFVSHVEQATERYACEDVTLHGITIPKGAMVLAVIASANRDEQQFAEPDRLDITRETPKHLAFGQGAHYCVGAPLARLEGQIAIATLVRRMPDLRLTQAPHTLRWRPGLTVRGLEALPVAISR